MKIKSSIKKLVTLSHKLLSFPLELLYFLLSSPYDFWELRIMLPILYVLVVIPFYSLSDLDTSLLTMLSWYTVYSTVYCNVMYRPGISEKTRHWKTKLWATSFVKVAPCEVYLENRKYTFYGGRLKSLTILKLIRSESLIKTVSLEEYFLNIK